MTDDERGSRRRPVTGWAGRRLRRARRAAIRKQSTASPRARDHGELLAARGDGVDVVTAV